MVQIKQSYRLLFRFNTCNNNNCNVNNQLKNEDLRLHEEKYSTGNPRYLEETSFEMEQLERKEDGDQGIVAAGCTHPTLATRHARHSPSTWFLSLSFSLYLLSLPSLRRFFRRINAYRCYCVLQIICRLTFLYKILPNLNYIHLLHIFFCSYIIYIIKK